MSVFDSSALLAIIFEEPGADIAAAHAEGAVISSVNWSEMGAKASDRGIDARVFLQQAGDLRIECAPFTREQADTAAALRATTRHLGLSLGDRACLALALSRKLPVFTADRAWRDLDVGVQIELIR